jgi:hypothetical protein
VSNQKNLRVHFFHFLFLLFYFILFLFYFLGYWNDSQKTKDSLMNGYFRTGDIVEINYDDNSIKVLGINKYKNKLKKN